MKSFFRRMVEEKGILNKPFEIEHNGFTHFMTVENVIDLIEQAPDKEKRQIKNMFSRIDFLNGDLMDYIKFLAKAFVANNY